MLTPAARRAVAGRPALTPPARRAGPPGRDRRLARPARPASAVDGQQAPPATASRSHSRASRSPGRRRRRAGRRRSRRTTAGSSPAAAAITAAGPRLRSVQRHDGSGLPVGRPDRPPADGATADRVSGSGAAGRRTGNRYGASRAVGARRAQQAVQHPLVDPQRCPHQSAVTDLDEVDRSAVGRPGWRRSSAGPRARQGQPERRVVVPAAIGRRAAGADGGVQLVAGGSSSSPARSRSVGSGRPADRGGRPGQRRGCRLEGGQGLVATVVLAFTALSAAPPAARGDGAAEPP